MRKHVAQKHHEKGNEPDYVKFREMKFCRCASTLG
jgi:hypothetical protein